MFFNGIGRGVAVFGWGAVLWLLATAPLSAEEHSAEPLLAKVYQKPMDLTQWWVSEKLDGVRAVWDGQMLRFRSGRQIHAPIWFTRDFPPQPLDGELWIRRGSFEKLSAVVRKQQPIDSEWRAVRYMIFELPGADGTFTERIQQIEQRVERAEIPWLQRVVQRRVGDESELIAWLDRVVVQGGEGLMLHRADSFYHGGRSSDLLKLKPWQDTEARVVAILPGKGKYQGKMGALLVEDEQGLQFRIGSGFSDRERANPPPIGSVITYKYSGRTLNGLPRFPSFLRLRSKL